MKREVKGLKFVHINNERWACGRITLNYQNTNRRHMVIYGPDRKQYDVALHILSTYK